MSHLPLLLIKLVDDLNFNLTSGSEDAIKISSGMLKTLAGAQIAGLRDTLQTAAQTHLLTSLISEAAVAKEPARLVSIRERFTAAAETAKKVAGTLNQDEIDKSVGDLVALGAARRRHLRAARQGIADRSDRQSGSRRQRGDPARFRQGRGRPGVGRGSQHEAQRVAAVREPRPQPQRAPDCRDRQHPGRRRHRRVLCAAQAREAAHRHRRQHAAAFVRRDRTRSAEDPRQ